MEQREVDTEFTILPRASILNLKGGHTESRMLRASITIWTRRWMAAAVESKEIDLEIWDRVSIRIWQGMELQLVHNSKVWSAALKSKMKKLDWRLRCWIQKLKTTFKNQTCQRAKRRPIFSLRPFKKIAISKVNKIQNPRKAVRRTNLNNRWRGISIIAIQIQKKIFWMRLKKMAKIAWLSRKA